MWVEPQEASMLTKLTMYLSIYDRLLAIALERDFRAKFGATFANLSVQQRDEPIARLLVHLGFDKGLSSARAADFKRDVLQHTRWCEVTPSTTTALPEIPTLNFLKFFPAVMEFLAHYEPEGYECKTFFSDSLGFSDPLLLGSLQLTESGGLVLADDTVHLPFFSTETEAEGISQQYLGKILGFESFEIVVEILGASTNPDKLPLQYGLKIFVPSYSVLLLNSPPLSSC